MKSNCIVLFLILNFLTLTASGQDCNCLRNFDSLYKTITTNYIGYHIKVTDKNRSRFAAFTQQLRQEARGRNLYDCYGILAKWVRWFKDQHLSLYWNYSDSLYKKIASYYRFSNRVSLTPAQVNSYLQKPGLDFIEGRWRDRVNLLSYIIIREPGRPGNFIGFLTKPWGTLDSFKVRFRLQKQGPGKYICNEFYYYSQYDKGPTGLSLSEGNLHFWGKYTLIRDTLPSTAGTRSEDEIIALYNNRFAQLSTQTAYLSLPNFDPEHKAYTDSVIDAHQVQLAASPNLIIDLRYNRGGVTTVFNKVLPYIYTRPIVMPRCYGIASPLVLNTYRGFLADTTGSGEEVNNIRSIVARMEQQPGQMVPTWWSDTFRLAGPRPNPRRVAVIVNKDCMSAAELFLLRALQSDKVILFGENSYGAINYLDMLTEIELPCPYYRCAIPITYMPPTNGKPVDNTGFAPQVRIPPSAKDWVKYVQGWLEKKKQEPTER